MNITESQLAEVYRNLNREQASAIFESKVCMEAAKRNSQSSATGAYEGPVDVTFTMHGHCPSKKNLWQRAQAGKMILPPEVREKISVLQTQAMFAWKYPGPVEHPEITVTFFVSAQRQDQDGMYTTILDILQSAGILINDNIAHNNGPKLLKPCEFVEKEEERVQITIFRGPRA